MRIVVRSQPRFCGGRMVVRSQGRETRREVISNPIIFQALERWVLGHKLPEAGSVELRSALEEIRRTYPNFTRGEVEEAIKRAQASNDHPWIDVSSALDWNQVTMEEEARQQARDASEIVKAAYQAGIITPQELELYRRPPPEISARAKAAYDLAIASLEKQLDLTRQLKSQAEARARAAEEKLAAFVPPPPPPPALPPTTLRGLVITPTVQDRIFDAYASSLASRGIQPERARQIALERQLGILSELQGARNLDDAEKIASELAVEDFRDIAQQEQALAKDASKSLTGFGPIFPGLVATMLPGAVRVRVSHPDGRVVWSGVVSIKTAQGIKSGSLKEDRDAQVKFYPPNVKVPGEEAFD
jgi:hypothetical protein